jgi:hypothetical protein
MEEELRRALSTPTADRRSGQDKERYLIPFCAWGSREILEPAVITALGTKLPTKFATIRHVSA